MANKTSYVQGNYVGDYGQVDFVLDNGYGQITRYAPTCMSNPKYDDVDYQFKMQRRAWKQAEALSRIRHREKK